MNKIFKVVWSKTKECYVVVSEVAKNNGGKKKVLASVLAGLAMVGAGAVGTPVQANVDLGNSAVNISPNGTYNGSNSVGVNSVVVGYQNTTDNNDGTLAYGANNNVKGNSAFAIGNNNKADGGNAYAMGNTAEAKGTATLAFGNQAKALADYGVAIGSGAQATANNAVAVGRVNKATNASAVALGVNNQANGQDSTAVGSGNTVKGDQASAFGRENVIDAASVAGATAVGYKNKASGDRAIAIGEANDSQVEDTITMGHKNTASVGGGIAIGQNNVANSGGNAGNTMIAIGRDNEATALDTVAIGRKTKATANTSVALGARSEATGSGSVAIGGNGDSYKTTSNGLGAVALGMQAKADGTAATAVGGVSEATANGAAAFGQGAKATAVQATALGYKSEASVKDGVALGSTSKATVDKGVKGFNPAEDRDNKYGGLAGTAQTSTLAAVSVGDGATATRQITGLAAGKEDTDAVNVAQLRSVNLKYAGDTGKGDVLLDNGTLTVKGEGLLSTEADATGIKLKLKEGATITDNNGKVVPPTPNGVATTDNVAQAINRSGWNVTSANNGGTTNGTTSEKVSPGDTVTFSAGKNIVLDQAGKQFTYSLNKDVDLTKDGSLTIGDTVINNAGMTITGGPSVTKTGINAGNKKITNVAPGTDDTDAVNVKQLKSAKTEVKAGDNVTVDKTIGADGQNIYTVNAKATNLGDAELNYTANGGAKQKVKLSEGLNFVDGNYTKASVDANGVVKYDVTLGKVKDGVDGKPGVDGQDGIATVKTVVDTINNSGWKGDVTGNTVGDHSATIVKPGTTVNFGAGKNLTVEQIVDKVTGNHTYNYALSDDIKVGNDGKDGKPGVDGKIGVNGKDGSAVVINGKDGSIGLNGKDGKDGLTFKGANGQDGVDGKNGTNGMTRIVYEDSNNNKHEVATTDDGLKFTGNNESVVNKNKLNSTVKVKGEGVTEEQEKTFESAAGNIAVTADGNDTLNIRLNKNIKGIDSIQTKEIHLGTPDNYTTIKKDGDRIKYGDKTFANTDDIWTIQANGTDVPANGGKVNVKGADGITVSKSANGEMTISGSGLGTMNSFNVKSSGNTTADSETAAKKITDGKTVEFSGGKNLTVKQTSDANGAKVEYALNNNVDLTNKGSVTIGDTKITDGGLVINNGPSVTKDGINAGNKQITNVEDGVNDTDAVNVRQLKAAKTNLVDGQNTKVTGDGSKANPYKVNVEGDLNKITSITNNEGDGKLEFKGDQVVNVAGDNTIKLDGKNGDITGLTNKTLDSADFATKGRAATEEQLKLVHEEAAKKSTEKVQAKADANNIAKVAPKAGDTFGAAGATYEVSVDKNDVKDAAREAVTVTGDNKAITVDVQPNATNHTTNYQVNFNGKEAAKQIPLTYKENGGNARTVMLSDGLDFSNGVNTTAHTDVNGKVSFDVKGDLTNITSISNNSNGPKLSFGGDTVNITGGNLNMGGNKITNVQRGTNDTDAVNVKQLKDSRTTLTSDDQSVVLKKTETADGGLNYDLSVKGAVDPRVDQLNEEIGRVGAQGAALSALKPMQYDPLEPTQIMAGYGNYRGNSAIAVGVAHYKNESTMFHGGLSWAGGSSHMMANAGVTWKVGNRDAEAAVADRYRKGPISSAYAVQTEMAAMKAQNAGLKGEVSDLKYENEQIKAQNAGLQSEVEVLKAQMAAMMAKMGM